MKLLYLAALICLPCSFSFGQDAPKDPVFKVSFDKESPTIGDTVEVILKADIPQGFHMYSTYNLCDIGPLKLEFNFFKHKSYVLIGTPYSVGDKRVMDEIWECELGHFDREAEIHQKIKILDESVILSGNIEGMWCSETTCFTLGQVEPVSFSSVLKAKPANAKPADSLPGSKPSAKSPNKNSIFLKPND